MESQSEFLDDKKTPDHKKLTCLLCTKYFKEPRFLPCHHTFCSSCLHNICQKADDLSLSKKQKIVCPKCKVHFNIPPNGIEGFPIDHKAQAMKDKVIQDLAQNISRTLNQPKEDSRFSSSPIGKHFSRGSKYSQNSTSDSENYTANSKESDYPASGPGNFSSRFGDFSKYAKYFSQDSSIDGESYRPTIRADHTRVGYESSTRFRNRQANSRERNSEEKDFKRRTWYGSTLHSRRAQSLNRTSMYAGLDDSEKKTESLFKIAEDKEHTVPSSDGSPGKSAYGSGTPPLRKSTSEEERPNFFRSRDEIKSRYSRPTSGSSHTDTLMSNKPGTSEADDRAKLNPRSGLGGPSRPSLSTHKENVTSETFFRQDSKDRKSPKEKSSPSGPRISLRTRKRSPKSGSFKDKKLVSPSASPRRQTIPLSPNRIKKDSFKTEETTPKTYVGSRHQRFQRSGGGSEQGQNESASRDSFDFSSRPPRESNRAWSAASRDRLHLNINVEEPILENHQQKNQEPLSKQNHSRKAHMTGNSLNKDDFDSESEFREHLLNITMSREKYQYIMGGLKDGQFERSRFCSTGSWDEPETPRTEMDSTHENKENTFVDSNQLNSADKNFSEIGNSSKNLKEEVRKKEPLLDDNLINSFRAKYMSSLDVKRDPKQLAIPEFADGVFKCWSYQKNDFGFPTSAAFLNSGNLVVADFGESCLEFFDSSGRLEHSVTGIKPFGVVATGRGKNVVVGDRKGKSIRIFDEFGADVSQIDDLGHPEWLSGMSVRRDGGLVLCDRARCKILVCTSAGEKLKEFGSFGSGPKQLCMADFLAVDSHDRIVVADSGNHCIKVFDSEGNHLTTIGSRGSGDGQFEWLKGIVVDENDNIIVADTLNRRVSLFSQDGVFVKHLMTSVFEPYNLAVSGNCLAVLHYNLKGMSQYDVYNY